MRISSTEVDTEDLGNFKIIEDTEHTNKNSFFPLSYNLKEYGKVLLSLGPFTNDMLTFDTIENSDFYLFVGQYGNVI